MDAMANDPLASVALDRLFEVIVRLGDAMQRDAVGRGLTRARATVLWELHRVGPVTQRALSDAMRVTPRNVTGLVDALETEGLVARRPHPTDRRATLVDLTQQGNQRIALLAAAYQQFTGFLFDDMPSDELRGFAAALERVLGHLRGSDFSRVRQEALTHHRRVVEPIDSGTVAATVGSKSSRGSAEARSRHGDRP